MESTELIAGADKEGDLELVIHLAALLVRGNRGSLHGTRIIRRTTFDDMQSENAQGASLDHKDDGWKCPRQPQSWSGHGNRQEATAYKQQEDEE